MRFWSLSCCVIQLELSQVASKVLGILLWHEAHAIAGDLDGATAHFAAACQLNLPARRFDRTCTLILKEMDV